MLISIYKDNLIYCRTAKHICVIITGKIRHDVMSDDSFLSNN